MGMDFNIQEINRQKELSLIEIFFNGKMPNRKKAVKEANTLQKDTFTISMEAKTLEIQRFSATSVNTRTDQSIDLQSYFKQAREQNQKAIENAGDEIGGNPKAFITEYEVYKAALTEKYSKLVTIAKSHSDPEQYIWQKYYNSGSPHYTSDLSEEERRIGYHNETWMLQHGTVYGVAFGDSLFRGVIAQAESLAASKREFDRQMVNSQINNILRKNGIELPDQEFSFTVTPFSYYISAEGVDDELRSKMECALNVGNNGENLYNHIRSSTQCEGITSTQITADGTLKNRLFYNTAVTLGLDVRELTERDGSYYTNTNENIIELYAKNVDQLDKSKDIKYAMKENFIFLVHQVAAKGWNNITDMVLRINCGQSGLCDVYQNYGFGATSREWLEGMLKTSTYTVM